MNDFKPYCTGFSASLIGRDKRNTYIYRPRCKQWNCPYCAMMNKRVWMYRMMKAVEDSHHDNLLNLSWFFWTLTLDGDDHNNGDFKDNVEHSLNVWRSCWDKLAKRIRRDMKKYTDTFTYVRVFETHKDGTLHIHIMSNVAYHDLEPVFPDDEDTPYTSKILTSHLLELSLGYIHDIKPVNSDRLENNGVARNVASYITKYMTKDIQSGLRDIMKQSGLGRIRLIQTSQGFPDIESNSKDDIKWSMDRLDIEEYVQNETTKVHKDISRDAIIDLYDFYEYDAYPNQKSDSLWRNELELMEEENDNQ